MNENNYSSGAASLFAAMAREQKDRQPKAEEPKKFVVVYVWTCPWCMSDDTKPVDGEPGTYVCTQCGEVFRRAV